MALIYRTTFVAIRMGEHKLSYTYLLANRPPYNLACQKIFLLEDFLRKKASTEGSLPVHLQIQENWLNWAEQSCIWVHFEMQFFMQTDIKE